MATASYNIDEIVFTDPTTAWFRYTITAPTGTFADRFGMATFNGRVWQITRATLCGDLALAGATCQPPTAPVEPPEDPDWLASYQEWVACEPVLGKRWLFTIVPVLIGPRVPS